MTKKRHLSVKTFFFQKHQHFSLFRDQERKRKRKKGRIERESTEKKTWFSWNEGRKMRLTGPLGKVILNVSCSSSLNEYFIPLKIKSLSKERERERDQCQREKEPRFVKEKSIPAASQTCSHFCFLSSIFSNAISFSPLKNKTRKKDKNEKQK